MAYTNKQMIRDIWSFVRPYKTGFLIGSFLRFSNDFLWLIMPWTVSEIINFVSAYTTSGPQELTYLYKLAGLSLFIGVYHHAMRDVAKYFIYPIAERAGIDASLKALRHIFTLNSAWHEKENSGNKMKRVENGYESINKIVRTYVDLLIESSVNIIFITVVFFRLDIRLNLIFVFFFITYYLLSNFFTKRAVAQSHAVSQEQEDFNGLGFETLNNIYTIKSLGIAHTITPYLLTKARSLIKNIKTRVKYFRTREGVLNVYQELFRLSMLGFTVWQVLIGKFTLGTIALVLLYFEKVESSAREFSMVYHEFIMAKIGLERLNEVFEEKPTIEISGKRSFNKKWKKLEIKNLSFAYHGQEVLRDISFTIHRGEKIGIVGISGTGKSTLFKLLLKLYEPTTGEVCFDGIPLTQINRTSFIENIAVVPQETELFNFSLKDNITLARKPHESAKNVEKRFQTALATAHITDFLHKLPEGVHSLIGEKGIKLSGGERQRVGIARAIIKQPDMLLLDEATSHLDSESEEKIQIALQEFFRGITAIVIAHRLATIKKMDRIIVIHKGHVSESGTFEELLKLKGEFFKLWQKQKF